MYKHLGILRICEQTVKNSDLNIINKQRLLLEIIATRKRVLSNMDKNITFNYTNYSDILDIQNQILCVCGLDPQEFILDDDPILRIIEALDPSI
jgi:hypothetical protein